MICAFSRFLVECLLKLTPNNPRPATSAVNNNTRCDFAYPLLPVCVVWPCVPRRAPIPEPARLIGRKPPQFGETAPPSSSADTDKIHRHGRRALIISARGSSGGLSRRITLVILRVQVSEHWEDTEMQWVYVASLTMSTYGKIAGLFLGMADKDVIIV
jgi:hypothetical protein